MKDVIAFDTETHLFGPANQAPKIVCLTYAQAEGSGIIVNKNDIENWLHSQLTHTAQGHVTLVGHYTAYDASVIIANFPKLRQLVFDAYSCDGITCTGIREKLLDIALGQFKYPVDSHGKKHSTGYHLADLAKIRLGQHLEKADTWRLRYAELDGVQLKDWPQDAIDYALKDAEVTFNMYRNQAARAEQIHYALPTEYEDTRADFALKLMSAWGIETDVPRVKDLWNNTVDKMHIIAEDLQHTGLIEVVPQTTLEDSAGRTILPQTKKSNKVLRGMIEQYYPGDPPRTKPTSKFPDGQIKTGIEVVQECDNEKLQSIVQFSKLEKLTSTYLSKMFKPVLHARFNGIGAASNRTSCSNPNLQNQSKLPGLRECFVPRPGHVFCSVDFDSQEMRTLAQSQIDICGRSKLAERYQADRYFDPHLEFAATMAGISIEQAQKLLTEGDESIQKLRQQTKIANFGFPGGMVGRTLVGYAKPWGIDITTSRGNELRTAWFQQWPEMEMYFEHVQNLIGPADSGTVIIPQSGFWRGDCGYTNSANTYFQTLAAHASKTALWEVCKKCYCGEGSALYNSRPVVFIHDEILTEVPKELGHEAALEIAEIFIAAQERWTPNVPAAASGTLMTCWSKSAEKVFENGRLIAWGE